MLPVLFGGAYLHFRECCHLGTFALSHIIVRSSTSKGHIPLRGGEHYLLGQKAYIILHGSSWYAFATWSSAVWVQQGAALWEAMTREASSPAPWPRPCNDTETHSWKLYDPENGLACVLIWTLDPTPQLGSWDSAPKLPQRLVHYSRNWTGGDTASWYVHDVTSDSARQQAHSSQTYGTL